MTILEESVESITEKPDQRRSASASTVLKFGKLFAQFANGIVYGSHRLYPPIAVGPVLLSQ
jgi:hypothetical protein